MEAIKIPIQCPECGSSIEFIGPKMFCRNKTCSAQSFGKIKKFLKIMGVLGIGDGILGALIPKYEIETSLDIVKVMMNDDLYHIEDIAKIKIGAASLGISRATKIREEVQALTNGVSLSVFIDSLQIPFLGTSNSKRVAEFCKNSLDDFLRLDTNKLLSIDKIGAEMSDAIMIGINQNRDIVIQMIQYIPIKVLKPPEIPKPEQEDKQSVPVESQLLGGASFCITGKLLKPKKYYYDIVDGLGGESHKDVKKDTTYLVSSDPGNESGKLKRARNFGTTVIDEVEFKRILGIT